MKITPVKFNTKYHCSFNSTKRTTYQIGQNTVVKPFYDSDLFFCDSKDCQIKASNFTYFFRNDLNWESLTRFLDTHFKNNDKVNVYNFACSDGSEACSLAISLIENLGEERARRFFPIKASDKDEAIIEQAKTFEFFAEEHDLERINRATKWNVGKYFEVSPTKGGYTLKAKDILRKNITFEQKDFYHGLDDVKGKNKLILCRNFWPYMGENEILKCAQKLHKKLNENSLAIIGKYDCIYSFPPSFLTELGIDCATDVYGEEFILKKFPYNKKGEYPDEKAILNTTTEYRKIKTYETL